MEDFKPLQLKHYLIFKLAEEKFAIDILDIESIHTSRRKGMFDDMEDLRIAFRMYKRLIPIINLRERFRLKGKAPLQPSLIFLKCKENDMTPVVGIQVDQTLEVIESMVHKKPDGKSIRLIKAMCDYKQEVIMVLRVKDIMNSTEQVNSMSPVMN